MLTLAELSLTLVRADLHPSSYVLAAFYPSLVHLTLTSQELLLLILDQP